MIVQRVSPEVIASWLTKGARLAIRGMTTEYQFANRNTFNPNGANFLWLTYTYDDGLKGYLCKKIHTYDDITHRYRNKFKLTEIGQQVQLIVEKQEINRLRNLV